MKKQKKVSRNYMDSCFVPDSEISFTKDEDEMVVVAVTHKGPFNWIAQKCFNSPRVSYITLDKYGTALWNCLDGNHTVFDIVNKMKECFPGVEDRMLDRVVTFLHTLQVQHFVKELKKTDK